MRLIVESPVRTIETNVNGTRSFSMPPKKTQARFDRLHFRSLRQKYQFPFREDADLVLGPTTKGRWSYAASKALDEFLALSFLERAPRPGNRRALFNTVGPRQTGRYGMVLPNFVQQALDGAPITVYGDGQQSRCFCDVQDTVEAVLAADLLRSRRR